MQKERSRVKQEVERQNLLEDEMHQRARAVQERCSPEQSGKGPHEVWSQEGQCGNMQIAASWSSKDWSSRRR